MTASFALPEASRNKRATAFCRMAGAFRTDVVFLIHLPPWIEHRAGRRRFESPQKLIELLAGHHLN